MPITWKNVDRGRGFSDAALIMGSATRSMRSGFSDLEGALSGVQDSRTKQADIRTENNNDAAKDIFAQYRSPEALEAARASGELEAQLQGLGDDVDQDLIRNGADQRQNVLRDQANTNNEYEDGLAQRAAEPYAEQIRTLILEDKDEEAAALTEKHRDKLDAAKLTSQLTEFQLGQDRTELQESNRQTDRATRLGDEKYNRERSRLEDGREDQTLADERALDDAYIQSKQDTQDHEAGQVNLIGDLATELGLSPNVDENTPEQNQALYERIEQEGGFSAPNFAEQITTSTRELAIANPTMTADQIDRHEERMIRSQAKAMNMNEADAVVMVRDQQGIDTQYDIAGNVFHQESTATHADVSELLMQAEAGSDRFAEAMDNQSYNQDVVSEITRLTQEGVDIGDGQFVKLVPSQVSNLILQVREKFYGNISIESIVADYVKSPGFLKQAKAFNNHRSASAKNKLKHMPAGTGGRVKDFQAALKTAAARKVDVPAPEAVPQAAALPSFRPSPAGSGFRAPGSYLTGAAAANQRGLERAAAKAKKDEPRVIGKVREY